MILLLAKFKDYHKVCALVQSNELNKNGELYVIRKPNLRTKIVDGTSLAAAAVLHMIPQGTTDVLLLGDATKIKMSSVLAKALCQREIQVPAVVPITPV